MSNLSTPAPPKIPELVYLFAASFLFGSMENWALLGILLVQVYLYYIAFPKDRSILKWTVFVQFILETIQTVTLAHDNIQHFSTAYTNPDILNDIGLLWISIPLMIGLKTHRPPHRRLSQSSPLSSPSTTQSARALHAAPADSRAGNKADDVEPVVDGVKDRNTSVITPPSQAPLRAVHACAFTAEE
ncbi:hypothetical protein HYPSUDRAFT_206094 [Hypholoma sublateritium FD-334 SS-4]|uniref:Uncharacterized protein n=1 Tax=Hypholoma sublateritium (strain FD-334 SS-4) TaxID=945553 RepID=A0A0D2PAX3_HYPSF|nr:hypothetical protein HYPSUDRAFT_206094 [Hypholoma sublateritium FD-334 SS-4]